MPFKSQAQRAFMYSQHPEIAKRWRKESGPQKGLPQHASKQNRAPAARASGSRIINERGKTNKPGGASKGRMIRGSRKAKGDLARGYRSVERS